LRYLVSDKTFTFIKLTVLLQQVRQVGKRTSKKNKQASKNKEAQKQTDAAVAQRTAKPMKIPYFP
jgi:hypothetical protein